MRTVLGLRLDLESGALSQYAGWNFNSLALIDGALYAASDQGLFRAGGEDDDGAPIEASIGLPAADFGHGGRKSLRNVDLEGRAFLGMRLSVRADDGECRERSAGEFGGDGEGVNLSRGRVRIPVGRDGQGTFFALSLANEEGGDFRVTAIEAAFLALDRR